MQTMTASVASKQFGRYLDTAQRGPVVVTKKNRPVVVTVSFRDWEELSKLFIECGLNQGMEDIDNGRFQEMNDASTLSRLNNFREM